MLRRAWRGLLAAVVGSACVLGIAPSARAALLINASIGSIASYEANGAGMLVAVTVTCQRGATFTFDDAMVVQRVPNSSLVVSAFLGPRPQFPACTGRARTVYLVFVGPAPLHRGSAATQIDVCVYRGSKDCRVLSAVIQVKQVEFPSAAMHTRGLGVRLSTATILAHGAALRVTGVMRCTTPQEDAGFVGAMVSVVQREVHGLQSAGNDAIAAPVCDGRYHRLGDIVLAGDRVWHPGQALVELDVSNCPLGLLTCVAATGVGTVTLG
jgi:hypothetical protein